MNTYAKMMSDTLETIERDSTLKEASLYPVEVFLYGNIPSKETKSFSSKAEIGVTRKSSSEAVLSYNYERVAVLNFASAINPGGGVRGGANAQEEALCRVSTLLPTLESESARSFYTCRKDGAFYSDSAMLSRDVIFFKSDDGQLLPKEEWRKADVLTIAAPNFSASPRRDDYEEVLEKRIETVFRLALYSGSEVLILGAFGCGVFGNPPEAVAETFRRVQEKYLYNFRKIEYAILARNDMDVNYSTFRRILLH